MCSKTTNARFRTFAEGTSRVGIPTNGGKYERAPVPVTARRRREPRDPPADAAAGNAAADGPGLRAVSDRDDGHALLGRATSVPDRDEAVLPHERVPHVHARDDRAPDHRGGRQLDR